jgi:hypothetical protein
VTNCEDSAAQMTLIDVASSSSLGREIGEEDRRGRSVR